jgi:hypothetical protein
LVAFDTGDSMNHDLALIAAVLESRDYTEAIRAGAGAELLCDEAQVFWDLISAHYEQFHEVPSIEHFSSLCPSYEHHTPQDSIGPIVHELKTIKLGTDIDKLVRDVAERNVADPWEAKTLLASLMDRVNLDNQAAGSNHVVGADKKKVLRLMERLRTGAGLLGHEWPWDYMNKHSMGVVPGNLVYIYGRQKSKKTWLLLYMALFYAMLKKVRVLFFTREMTPDELKLRAYAIACGFEWTKFTKGELTDDSLDLLADIMDEIASSENFIITDVADGMQGYKAKVEEVKPAIVMHDCFKAMADDAMADNPRAREHTYVGRVADQLTTYHKDFAKIPLFFCGHANREGDKTMGRSSTEHAWSDHITRKVDYALRAINNDAEDLIGLIVNEGRNVRKFLSWTVNGNLCRGLGEQLLEDCDWVENLEEARAASSKSRSRNAAKPDSAGRTRFRDSDFVPKRPRTFRSR